MLRACCRKVATVWYLVATSTLTGSRRHARCSFCTFDVIVALYSCVQRSRGMTCTQTGRQRQDYKDLRGNTKCTRLQNLIQLLLKIQRQNAVRLVEHKML